MALYLFLKFLARLGLTIFFRKRIRNHSHLLPTKGPLILAVNHPNTLMDVLIAAVYTKQRVGFLANASLFENPWIGGLLHYLHAIPVFRKQDLKKGETMDNSGSFRKCVEYLESGGTLMIFPEGSSYSEMKLRKLKTGLARIALAFAEETNFKKDLSVVPIGLNYSDPLHFRSDVITNYGAPISIRDYEKSYKDNQAKAVHNINNALKNKLESQLVLLEDKPQEKLFKDLWNIFSAPTDRTNFSFQYNLAEELRDFKQHKRQVYDQIESLNHTYQQAQNELKLSYSEELKPIYQLLFKGIGLILMFPIFIFGLLIHVVPAFLCSILPPRATKEIEYWAALKLLFGIFLFPIWYFLLALGAYLGLSLSSWQVLTLLISFPISGILTIHYWEAFQSLKNDLKLTWLKRKMSESFLKLIALKSEISDYFTADGGRQTVDGI